jgi:hypothetical protein
MRKEGPLVSGLGSSDRFTREPELGSLNCRQESLSRSVPQIPGHP